MTHSTSDAGQGTWYSETLHRGLRTSIEARKVLFDSETEHQRLVVIESVGFGKVVLLDGVIQLTTSDEFIYHEMLAHLPILAHGAVSDVLIVGGGDGGMAEEALKHDGVKRLTMVEIDAGVIDFAREHLAEVNKGCFDDPRFDLVIADGKDFVASTDKRYDLVIVDSTDPIGPGEVLFTETFYGACKSILKPGGILVTQNGVPFFQAGELKATMAAFSGLFADASCYLASVPTYFGGDMAFGWGTDNADLRTVPLETLKARYAASGIDTRYYTPEVHQAAFALPAYVRDMVEAAGR
ncbi:polyamine aminopropyltransferase [Kaustia mangrovi]|uniref:Polyamine aminopropyltransferase n=1 Tax=Kaustia mangrovi TaxID=2593653 RepID=A0A7S8HDJ0_9HYPH|nr:polyamine aminopropyltransferase [Kaustia mangrovi]QPC44731.1 polyamine aminopropyltransferase [Kaustia mangrovi]